jgi:hypothetical protein
VEGAPALLQEAAAGDLMDRHAFDGALQVGEETGLIFRTLKASLVDALVRKGALVTPHIGR